MGIRTFLKYVAGSVAPSVVLVRGSRACRAVSLTFDDGPHHANTPVILDVLSDFGVPATFFVQGVEVQKCPDLVRAIAARGHIVGNHGFHHRHWPEEPVTALLRDVEAAQAVIQDAAGQPQPRIYRPPYGELTARGAWLLWRRGYRIVLWSADSHDSFDDTPDAILGRLEGPAVRSGDILLLHDDGAHTIAVLPRLIERILARGLAIRPLAELHTRTRSP
jgi:peptidoglycan/xylan/chitin deacetylase (PgdA/CDA1 family)